MNVRSQEEDKQLTSVMEGGIPVVFVRARQGQS